MSRRHYKPSTGNNRFEHMTPEKREEHHDRTLFCRNVHYRAARDDFRQFQFFVDAVDINIPERRNGSPKGIAFIEYATAAKCHDALAKVRLYEQKQQVMIYGRELIINQSRSTRPNIGNMQTPPSSPRRRVTNSGHFGGANGCIESTAPPVPVPETCDTAILQAIKSRRSRDPPGCWENGNNFESTHQPVLPQQSDGEIYSESTSFYSRSSASTSNNNIAGEMASCYKRYGMYQPEDVYGNLRRSDTLPTNLPSMYNRRARAAPRSVYYSDQAGHHCHASDIICSSFKQISLGSCTESGLMERPEALYPNGTTSPNQTYKTPLLKTAVTDAYSTGPEEYDNETFYSPPSQPVTHFQENTCMTTPINDYYTDLSYTPKQYSQGMSSFTSPDSAIEPMFANAPMKLGHNMTLMNSDSVRHVTPMSAARYSSPIQGGFEESLYSKQQTTPAASPINASQKLM